MKLKNIEQIGINLSDLESYRYFSKRKDGRDSYPRYKINNKFYFYKDKCKSCGDSFLCLNPTANKCVRHCGFNGEGNPFYGKTHTKETIKKMSECKKDWMKHNPHPTESVEVRKKISESKLGEKHHFYGKRGEGTGPWKGGYGARNIPLYDTYAHQIDWCELVRRNKEDQNILEVKCTYCGKWFVPSLINIYGRIQYLKGNSNYGSEHRLYCSNGCKKECPIFFKSVTTIMREDKIRAGKLDWIELNREIQPELRQMVFERDNYTCQKCKSKKHLHCHHIKPVAIEPIESADIDNCITYCKNCHKKTHTQDGCKYGQLRMCA